MVVDNFDKSIEILFNRIIEDYTQLLTSKHDYYSSLFLDILRNNKIKLYNSDSFNAFNVTLNTTKIDIIATYKILKYPLEKLNQTIERYLIIDPIGKTLYIFYGGNYHSCNYRRILENLYSSYQEKTYNDDDNTYDFDDDEDDEYYNKIFKNPNH